MINLLADQPAEWRESVAQALSAPVIHMAALLWMDFLDQPVALSNRSVPFVDRRWGRTWESGSHLLVGVPDRLSGGDNNLAPHREFHLGLLPDLLDVAEWGAAIVDACRAKSNYARRDALFGLQLFDPVTDAPLGWPIIEDWGLMDRMTFQVAPGGQAMISLTIESVAARKGVPVYGALTWADQKRRFSTDEFGQFTTEAGKLITWTDW